METMTLAAILACISVMAGLVVFLVVRLEGGHREHTRQLLVLIPDATGRQTAHKNFVDAEAGAKARQLRASAPTQKIKPEDIPEHMRIFDGHDAPTIDWPRLQEVVNATGGAPPAGQNPDTSGMT